MIRNSILIISLIFITWGISCDWGERKDNTCDDGEISAADAVWSHGEGDLQNSKRASGIRPKGCITGPQTAPQVQWSFQIGGPGLFSPPVIDDDGTIYIVGEYPGEVIGGGVRKAGIMALTPAGTMKWFFQIPLDVGTGITYFYTESVALDKNGLIYFGAWDSTLYVINPNGTLKWKHYISGIPEFSSSSSPVVGANNLVYVASPDTVYCFDCHGNIKWRYAIEEDCSYASQISLGRKGIYIGLYRTGILAIDYLGYKKWIYSVDFHDLDFDQGIIIDEQENLYFKINHFEVLSINSNGQFRWNGTTSDLAGQPVLRGQFLYLPVGRTLFKIDKDRNEIASSILLSNYIYYSTSPLVDDNGTIYVGSIGGYVDAIFEDSTLWSMQFLPFGSFINIRTYPALSKSGALLIGTAWTGNSNEIFGLYALK